MKPVNLILFTLLFFAACSKSKDKDKSPEEHLLYGKWEMGPDRGDTIEFLNKNGQDILRYYDGIFISGIYMERPYRYSNGNLSIQMYPTENFSPAPSFTRTQQGNAFTIRINEFYPLLSTSVTVTYRKIP